jgi:apolipoprotein N-acyltransferase
MSRGRKLLLSLSSGVLLWLAWPPLPLFPLLFIGFIPLLWLDEVCREKEKSARCFFGYTYLALLIWNLLTTWWVGATYFGTGDISTAIAGLIANSANPLLMSIPMLAFHRTRKKFGDAMGYVSLPAYWITFEFIHLRWDLSWPWLTLGNGFAAFPAVVQWYEITGALGGSLWILAVNILLFRLFLARINDQKNTNTGRMALFAGVLLLFPMLASVTRYITYKEKGTEQEVVVVQPNIDPYSDKFDPATLDAQMATLIALADERVDSSTDFLVFPETALPDGIFLNELHSNPFVNRLANYRASFPDLKVITGISAYAKYSSKKTATARRSQDGTFYWDAFNTAIQLDSSSEIPFYHKSKLVPGVEKMPYPELFKFLEPLALDMGGTSGSLGSQETRTVFNNPQHIGAAPLICYESVYGEYTTEYVRNGGDLLFIITNDGWWGNTAGYRQHFTYARLRAVETRRSVARSANTGISGFINQRGEVLQSTAWWQPVSIKGQLRANETLTFYSRFGDLAGRLAAIITLVLFLYSIWMRLKNFVSRKPRAT